MAKITVYVGARMTPEEYQRVKELAKQADTTPSEVLRALVRAALTMRPVEATIDEAKFLKA